MDFSFSEEQLAAVEAARAVFAVVAPDAVPSPALAPGPVAEDFNRVLWRRLAEADLLSLVLDEAYGGAGLDPVALCLVLREAGGVLARVPLLETCAAVLAIQQYGPPELRDRLLPAVGRGCLVLTVAANGRTGPDAAELAVSARQGEGWVPRLVDPRRHPDRRPLGSASRPHRHPCRRPRRPGRHCPAAPHHRHPGPWPTRSPQAVNASPRSTSTASGCRAATSSPPTAPGIGSAASSPSAPVRWRSAWARPCCV